MRAWTGRFVRMHLSSTDRTLITVGDELSSCRRASRYCKPDSVLFAYRLRLRTHLCSRLVLRTNVSESSPAVSSFCTEVSGNLAQATACTPHTGRGHLATNTATRLPVVISQVPSTDQQLLLILLIWEQNRDSAHDGVNASKGAGISAVT